MVGSIPTARLSKAGEAMRYTLNHPDHPLWKFLKYLVGVTAVTITLYVNAEDFNLGEHRAIGVLAMLMGGVEVMEFIWRRFFDK